MKQSPIKKASMTLEPIKQSSRLRGQRQPFSVSRMTVTSRTSGDAPRLCKKCESLVTGMNSDSIHSTLAYSRCRCHRLFKYRTRKIAKTTPTTDRNGPDHDTTNLKIESTMIQLVPSKARLSAAAMAAGSMSNFTKAHTLSSTRLEEGSLVHRIAVVSKERLSVVLPPIAGAVDTKLPQKSLIRKEQLPEVASKAELRDGTVLRKSVEAVSSKSKLPAIR